MKTCILVCGIGASGTSMIAGVLHNLGVWMGHEAHLGQHPGGFSLYEDAEFYGVFNERLPDKVYLDLIYRHQKPLWGWKNTLTIKAFPWIVDLLRQAGNDTRIVAMHRELVGSIRGRMEGHCPPGAYYEKGEAEAWALEAYRIMCEGLLAVDVPVFHVGFVETRNDPEGVVRRLAEFAYKDTGKRPEWKQMQKATDHVEPRRTHGPE